MIPNFPPEPQPPTRLPIPRRHRLVAGLCALALGLSLLVTYRIIADMRQLRADMQYARPLR